jgi:hypothetical protein
MHPAAMEALFHAWSASLGILSTYVRALPAASPWFVVLFVSIAVLTSRAGRSTFARLSPVTRATLGVCLILGSLISVYRQASLFDDAYITLRYAKNLADGHGLVFNIGERVEGYTNFLWAVILAGAFKLGLHGERFAVIACTAAFVLELVLILRLSRLLRPAKAPTRLPWAAIFLACNAIFTAYGTTGMETMLAALLMTAAFERALKGHLFWSGLLGIAAAMSHPDHILLYGGLGAALLFSGERKRLVAYSAPFALVFLPYYFLRWRYYGDFFPNTYYAKSGGSSYFSQGWVYVLASLLATGVLLLVPLAIRGWRTRTSPLLNRFVLFGLAPYLVYVAKVGGDFMLGRLLVVVLPFAALLAGAGLEAILSERSRGRAFASMALFALACAPVTLIAPHTVSWNIADESTFYRVTSFAPFEVDVEFGRRARLFQKLMEKGIHPVICEENVGYIGYKTGLTIIDGFGLTDRHVAHQEMKGARGRPGHERRAEPSYLRERGVRISLEPFYTDSEFAQLSRFRCGWEELYLPRYDTELIPILRRLACELPDPAREIDRLLSAASEDLKSKQLRAHLDFFDEFYFSTTSDPDRRQRLLNKIALVERSPADATAQLPAH